VTPLSLSLKMAREETMQFDHWTYQLIIFIIGFVASFIGATTGGGGLISIPTLIFIGFNPAVAISTVKLGAIGSIATGWYGFHRGKKINYRIGIPAAIIAGIGSIIGAQLLITAPKHIINPIIGGLMIVTLFIILFKKAGLKTIDTKNLSMQRYLFGWLLFFLIGIWGGFLGGEGTFISYILILVFGATFLESAGTRKVITFTVTVFSFILLAKHQLVNWKAGIIILMGMSLGSYFGVRYGLKKGDAFVRKLFALVVTLMAIKLILF